MHDKMENERVNARNSVEEYVLQTRGRLYDEYEKFVTEEVRIYLQEKMAIPWGQGWVVLQQPRHCKTESSS